ncbi:MAG: efflux RND transporter permease subunit [Gordonia sp. (in: high G+C Gram-positive bacteria)]|uniref:MMPL family transporter n=1 Tax=Gordonia sp. (in: high G+C Gram-positive bacteria) TaxID=84139 RepID=UPI003C73D09C
MSTSKTARWTRQLLPALVIIGWLLIGGVGGPLIGQLASVQSNSETSYLPSSAESTRAAELQKQFADSETVPAVVVAARDDDQPAGPAAAEYLQSLQAWSSTTFRGGEPGPPPIPSADGRALQLIVPVPTTDISEEISTLREHISDTAPADLQVKVGGPAGQAADLGEAFAGIDGLLLIVAASIVFIILVIVYRSPLLPIFVLLSAVFALAGAGAIVYLLAKANVLTLNGQSQGILFILVMGAATDYALLFVSRYREELHLDGQRVPAVIRAWRATVAPITASAGTVVLGVLCLMFSELNSNRSLGPIAAIGIVSALVASLTFLPAVLALTGRTAFWPMRPVITGRSVEDAEDDAKGIWWTIANKVDKHHTKVWVITALGLAVFAGFAPQFKASGIPQSQVFLTHVDSADAQEMLSEHFPGGSGSPVQIFAKVDAAPAVVDQVQQVPGVANVSQGWPGSGPAKIIDGRVAIQATLETAADSDASEDTVRQIRTTVHAIPGADAVVGGTTATQIDTQDTAARDRNIVIPLVLLVVLIVLILLLRAIVAPVLLLLTVVLSFAATLGIGALVFNHVFHFPGADPTVPLFAFVFLVALGVDYNIFLMTRVREEAKRHGTREGVRRGLAVTGSVITSAGIVLAATFSALAVIPLIFLAQVAFLVAVGVLIDTILVRSALVPALTLQIGRRVWWPSALGAPEREAPPEAITNRE